MVYLCTVAYPTNQSCIRPYDYKNLYDNVCACCSLQYLTKKSSNRIVLYTVSLHRNSVFRFLHCFFFYKMDKLAEIFPPEVMPDIKKLLENGMPGTERAKLWGHYIVPGFSAEAVQNAYKNWDVRKTDVLLASYQKTGKNIFCC